MRALTLTIAVLVAASPTGAERRRPGGVVTVAHDAPAALPTFGPSTAAVTIELFVVNARSTTSTRLYRDLRALHQRHPTRLRVIFRFPYSDVFSNAARVAFRQGDFRKVMDALYDGRYRRRNQLEKVIRDLGVDWERFEPRLKAGYHADLANHDRYYAKRWGLRQITSSRPGLLINGRPDRARRHSLESLERAYDEAYGRARRLLDRGVSASRLYAVLRQREINNTAPLELAIGSVDGDPVSDAERENHPSPAGYVDFRVAHFKGNSDAKVTLAWFCSLQSSHCGRLFRALREVERAFPDEVRLAFFHAYQGGKDQPGARRLHLAALCAEQQGDYWGFLSQVYARSRRGEIKDEYLELLAEATNLDAEQLLTCSKSPATRTRLRKALAVARRARITRTPTVVIGGLAYLGSRDYYQLSRLVEGQLREGVLGRYLWPNLRQ
ncbi:MAG: thioredoxin domain-containing protein [Deltaproteobacteria bacterium]|nr:thioredoxin domain-containing protein [Deltaproteobacteria bacterium]